MILNNVKLFLKSAGKVRLLPRLDCCQILAVDNGIENLKECFPSDMSYFHVPIRGEVFYFNWHVFIALSKLLITKQSNGFGFRGCYVAAIAQHLKPKVIVTMIDNNNWDTNLSENLNIPIICIGNGLRIPSHLNDKHFDCYFALSTAPVDPELSFNCSCNEFYAAGHFKMGIYMDKYWDNAPILPMDKSAVLWISQFREFIYFSAQDHFVQQKRAELMGIKFMSRFASGNYFNARVAITSERKNLDKDTEISLFESAGIGNLAYSEGFQDEWVSYHEVRNASLVVGMSSTLLFECLSIGKRVIFVLPEDCPDMLSYIGQGVRLDLLAPLIFSGNTYEGFAEHSNRILEMSETEYSQLIEPIRNHVAPFDKSNLPHHQIRDKISEIVSP